MTCAHCGKEIHLKTQFESEVNYLWDRHTNDHDNWAYRISFGECPACRGLIVIMAQGHSEIWSDEIALVDPTEQVLYPTFAHRKIEQEVPEDVKKEYLEAIACLDRSAKASAALSRRLLQRILGDDLNIEGSSLSKQIDVFLDCNDVPEYLSSAVDAVRNIGNFAAHPLKDTSTAQIVEVEKGEAEWLLDVLDALFDFVYVQPERLKQRRAKLNDKLNRLGKPPMKGD